MRLNTKRRELTTEFTDSELDAVSGGEGNLANACIRATIDYMQYHTYKSGGFSDTLYRDLGYCN